MTFSTTSVNLKNSVNECAQSLRKENAGKYYNYSIQDCIASITVTNVVDK